MSKEGTIERLEEIENLPEEISLKEYKEIEDELNELIKQEKIDALEVQAHLFKAPTDKEVIEEVRRYLSQDRAFEKAIEILKGEGVVTTAEELREFMTEPVTKEVRKIYSALIKGTYKKIEMSLKLFRDAQIETSPSPLKGRTFLSKDDERLLMDLQPYYARDIEDKSDLWFDGISHEDFFKKLAKRYGKSKDGIKKFAQRHDPNNPKND